MAHLAVDLEWARPPQQARSQATMGRILDAAEQLFGEKGFEETTIVEIVRRAESSVGAFYTRFKDKNALLHALYDRFYASVIATADAATDPARWEGASIPQIVGATVGFLTTGYRQRAGLLRAFILRNRSNREFGARQERASQYVSARFSELLLARRSAIRHPDPELATRFGLTLAFSTLESAILFREMRSGSRVLSDDELAHEVTRAFLTYLGIDPQEA